MKKTQTDETASRRTFISKGLQIQKRERMAEFLFEEIAENIPKVRKEIYKGGSKINPNRSYQHIIKIAKLQDMRTLEPVQERAHIGKNVPKTIRFLSSFLEITLKI